MAIPLWVRGAYLWVGVVRVATAATEAHTSNPTGSLSPFSVGGDRQGGHLNPGSEALRPEGLNTLDYRLSAPIYSTGLPNSLTGSNLCKPSASVRLLDVPPPCLFHYYPRGRMSIRYRLVH